MRDSIRQLAGRIGNPDQLKKLKKSPESVKRISQKEKDYWERINSPDVPILPLGLNFIGRYFLHIGTKTINGRNQEGVIKKFTVPDQDRGTLKSVLKYFNRMDSKDLPLSKGLTLIGVPGSGKTTLMKIFSVINYECKSNPFVIVPVRKIIRRVKEEGVKVLNEYEEGIVCFDDLGLDRSDVKDYGDGFKVMDEIIHERYNKNLLTFFTTNLSPGDIKEKYGERTYGRLYEMTTFVQLQSGNMRTSFS